MNVKELNEWAHEKGSDDGSDSCDCRNLSDAATGHKEQHAAKDYAYDIGDDPDILEFSLFPGVDYYKGDSVIGGYTEVSSHVKGRAEADDDNSDDKVCHEGLEWINAKGCNLEYSDADGADDNTKQSHGCSLWELVYAFYALPDFVHMRKSLQSMHNY